MRTLRIMEGVFRRGMLEEVLMEMGVVHAIFPCLDQLLSIHSSFLSQLLQRRNHSLAASSTRNFTIQKLGDILVEQVNAHLRIRGVTKHTNDDGLVYRRAARIIFKKW